MGWPWSSSRWWCSALVRRCCGWARPARRRRRPAAWRMRPGCAACRATGPCSARQRRAGWLLGPPHARSSWPARIVLAGAARREADRAGGPQPRHDAVPGRARGRWTATTREVVREFREIVSGLRGDRVGMTIWSGAAVTAFPLTDDYEFLAAELDRAETAFQENDYDYVAGIHLNDSRASLIGDGLVSCVQRVRPAPTRSAAVHRAGLGQRPPGATDLHAGGRGTVRRRPRRRRLRDRLAGDAHRRRGRGVPRRRRGDGRGVLHARRERFRLDRRGHPAPRAHPDRGAARAAAGRRAGPRRHGHRRRGRAAGAHRACAGRSGGGDDPPTPRPHVAGRAGRPDAARGRRVARRTTPGRAPLVAAARADGAAGHRDRAASRGGGAARRGTHLRPRGAGRRRPHGEHVGAGLGRRAAAAGGGAERPARARPGTARRAVLAGHRGTGGPPGAALHQRHHRVPRGRRHRAARGAVRRRRLARRPAARRDDHAPRGGSGGRARTAAGWWCS